MRREAAVGEKPIGKSDGIDVRALREFSGFTPAGMMVQIPVTLAALR